jgi:hypothetical protein
MLSFNQYVTEQSIAGGFNIPRASMPQIADQEGFAKYLEFIGISVVKGPVALASIKPTQTEYDQAKVDSMTAPYGSIIVANDSFILDGHHRYFGALRDQDEIDAYSCDATINQLLKHANDYLSDE